MNAPLHRLMTADPVPVHQATTLTRGGTTAQTLLNGHTCTLRITRAGKRILTK